MISKATANGTPSLPSRNSLRLVRNIALAGSTIGTFCAAAVITYDINRRIRLAERIVENKRTLQTSAPRYDATSAARQIGKMMEVAESGEFSGIDSLKEEHGRRARRKTMSKAGSGGMNNGERKGNKGQAHVNEAGRNSSAGNRGDRGRSTGKPLEQPPSRYKPLELAADFHRFHNILGRSHGNAQSLPGDRITTSGDEDTSVSGKMNQLLHQHQAIEAAQLFIDTYPDAGNQISSAMQDIVTRVFYMNCKQGNVFIAKAVFLRLIAMDKATQTMLDMLVFALAKNGSIETVSSLVMLVLQNNNRKNRLQISPTVLDIVIRSLVESRRLTTAKKILFKNLEHDRNCGLCGAYLAGVWRKTRSIELLNGIFRKLLNVLPRMGKRPSDKLFNPMLKAYVEFGRLADAETLVDEMVTKYNITAHCRTKGLLVFGKALQGDWAGVKEALQEMQALGLTYRRDFVQIFDRIFLEYWVSHTGEETRDFVFHYIDKFGIVPDRVLYKHILEAFVEKGDESMITELRDMYRARAWTVPMSEKKYLDLLRSKRLALEESPVGFWKMFRAAREKHGQAIISQQVLGYDQRSFPDTDVNKMPYTGSRLPWHERSLKTLTAPRRADNYQKLEVSMAYHMHVGNMLDALAFFNGARDAGFCLKQIHLELALIAILIEHGHHAAREFIAAESESIQSSFPEYPELYNLVAKRDSIPEVTLIKAAVFRFYELCVTTKNLRPKHSITVTVSRLLLMRLKPEQAIDLMASVYMSRYRYVADITDIYMKIFLRAFGEANNLQGVRWCILTVLARDMDTKHGFTAQARIFLYKRKQIARDPNDVKLEYLSLATDLLQEKESEGGRIRGRDDLKRLSRTQLKKPKDEKLLFQPGDIIPTIESWDEEYELEAALGLSDDDSKLWEEMEAEEEVGVLS